jgi:uncharacterized protein YkvS
MNEMREALMEIFDTLEERMEDVRDQNVPSATSLTIKTYKIIAFCDRNGPP